MNEYCCVGATAGLSSSACSRNTAGQASSGAHYKQINLFCHLAPKRYFIPTVMAESATTRHENPVQKFEGLVILHHWIIKRPDEGVSHALKETEYQYRFRSSRDLLRVGCAQEDGLRLPSLV